MKSKRSHRKQKPQGNEKEPFFPASSKVAPPESSPFFQPKLEISPANDPSEKEADEVANEIVDAPSTQHGKQTNINRKERLNRQAEEEEPQAKRIQKQEEEEETMQAKRIQKQEEEELQAKRIPNVQSESDRTRQTKGKEDPAAPASFEKRLERTKGQGFALPDDLRLELEDKFGAGLKAVRIHTDAEAIALCQSIQAQAFTHGYHIYFNQGKYQPHSTEGLRLLAHEMTHVIQQKGK